jgi:hypothetical protein
MSRGRFAELLLPLSIGRAVVKLMKMSLSLMYFRRFLISAQTWMPTPHPDLFQTWKTPSELKLGKTEAN